MAKKARSARSIEVSREGSARRKNENRERVNALKEQLQCEDCPSWVRWPAVSLHFDHLGDEPKYRNVSDMMSRAWTVIETEIAKCQVVCANHHAVRTQERRLMEEAARADS